MDGDDIASAGEELDSCNESVAMEEVVGSRAVKEALAGALDELDIEDEAEDWLELDMPGVADGTLLLAADEVELMLLVAAVEELTSGVDELVSGALEVVGAAADVVVSAADELEGDAEDVIAIVDDIAELRLALATVPPTELEDVSGAEYDALLELTAVDEEDCALVVDCNEELEDIELVVCMLDRDEIVVAGTTAALELVLVVCSAEDEDVVAYGATDEVEDDIGMLRLWVDDGIELELLSWLEGVPADVAETVDQAEAVEDPEDDVVGVVTTPGGLDIVADDDKLLDGGDVDAPKDELVDVRTLDNELELLERALLMLMLLELVPALMPHSARN